VSNIHCKDCGATLGYLHNPGCPKHVPVSNLPELPIVGWTYISEDPLDGGEEMLTVSEPNRREKWPLVRLSDARAFAEQAVKQERERCARVAEEVFQCAPYRLAGKTCADHIRNRGIDRDA